MPQSLKGKFYGGRLEGDIGVRLDGTPKFLVQARLVISRKRGRTRELFFNAAPIQMIYDRWTDEYSAFWATQAVDLKYQAEDRARKTGAAGPRRKARSSPGKRR